MFAPDHDFRPEAFASRVYPHDIDPALAALTAFRSVPAPDRYRLPFPEAREMLLQERRATQREWPVMASVTEETLSHEGRQIGLRWYRPLDVSEAAPIIYLHGGGWCVGSNETHDTVLRHLAAASGRAICGVDYALAPEHPFPQASNDLRHVVDLTLERLQQMSPAQPRVILAGDSAGANLALTEAMRRRDEGGDPPWSIAGLLLFYGVYAPMGMSGSIAAYGQGGYGLTQAIQERYLAAYAPGHGADPRVFPLLGELHGLPPAWLLAAGRDMLLDDSVRLHHVILGAGGRSELKVAEGMTHGYLNLANVLPAAAMALKAAGAYAKALG